MYIIMLYYAHACCTRSHPTRTLPCCIVPVLQRFMGYVCCLGVGDLPVIWGVGRTTRPQDLSQTPPCARESSNGYPQLTETKKKMEY
jgi:hypothetical protein